MTDIERIKIRAIDIMLDGTMDECKLCGYNKEGCDTDECVKRIALGAMAKAEREFYYWIKPEHKKEFADWINRLESATTNKYDEIMICNFPTRHVKLYVSTEVYDTVTCVPDFLADLKANMRYSILELLGGDYLCF